MGWSPREREQARRLLDWLVSAALDGHDSIVSPVDTLCMAARVQRALLREEWAARWRADADRAPSLKAAREEKRSQDDARHRAIEGQIRRSHHDFGGTLGDAAIADRAGVSRSTVLRLRNGLKRPRRKRG